MTSSLYVGTVAHRRFGPKPHALRYRMMMALLDLDDLDTLDRSLRLFSRNKFNLFSFHDRDHAETSALRAEIEAHLQAAGLALKGGAIKLLSLPRILGYAFNPLSVYFCHRADGALAAILYEVRNTFGQRHTYLIPVEPGDAGPIHQTGPIYQTCRKVFYVSPFMDLDMTYAFRVVPPGDNFSIGVDALKGDERIIATSFAGERRPLTDRTLLLAFLGHPFLALTVVAGIHWEALRLWLKGIGLRARPPAPAHPVSIIHPKEI